MYRFLVGNMLLLVVSSIIISGHLKISISTLFF